MTKRSLVVVAGLFSFCISLSAQQIRTPGTLGSLNAAWDHFPLLTLSDPRSFPFSNTGAWVGATMNDFLPDWKPAGWENSANLNFATTMGQYQQTTTTGSSIGLSKDSSKEGVDLARSNPFEYVHGEVGFMYGRSVGGKNSFDVESGYIFGVTGNDKFQISAGAFYENSNVDFSRRRR
jgi:hypothetical protein